MEKLGFTIEEARMAKEKYESLKVFDEDDFLKNFASAYRNHQDPTKVLSLMTTDFSKMSPQELVKYDLRERYPDVSERVFERLLEEEYSKYGIDENALTDEDEDSPDVELMNLRTREIRQRLTESREKFLASTPSAQTSAEYEKFINFVKSHPATQSLAEQKVVFGDFNYAVDKDSLLEYAIDGQKFFDMFNHEGQVNLDKFYKVAAFAKDPDAFLKAQNAHAVAKAKIEWLKELKNPSINPTPKPSTGEVRIRVI